MKIESRRIGQYELRQILCQDTSSETWQAYDTGEQRTVVLKFFSTDLLDTPTSLTSYLQSVEKIASLHHPNIVHIHDIQVIAPATTGEEASLICLAVEYIEGETLADYIRQISAIGKMPLPSEMVRLISSLAVALGTAQQHGFLHGNLKPTNILLSQPAQARSKISQPVLTDFAESKPLSRKQRSELPFYISPEQIKGQPIDERSDVYALGVMLYEIYTGTLPFRGNRPIAIMMQHINAQPTSPGLMNPGLSPALTQVILRCLAKEPRERFPNAASLAASLADALHVPVPNSLRHYLAASGTQADHVEQLHPHPEFEEKHTTPVQSVPPRPSTRRSNQLLVMLSAILLTLILGASFEVVLFLRRSPSATNLSVGQAFFLNSGQLNESTTQGINDELQIELHSLPDPATGQSYYAWLLSDTTQTETLPLLLGRLSVNQGKAQLLYPGNDLHANLLATASRFLITEDSTQSPSSNPLLDQASWRYYATIPQTPDPQDALHFSMLDHLRHLLVESPELSIRGLHGGLAFWFVRDTASISSQTMTLADDWQNKDATALRDQVIKVLDTLDGSSFINADVPAGTPFLDDTHTTQVPLLGPPPQSEEAPGYVYQNQPPPGFIYLVQTHLNGAVLAPQTTPAQHQLAVQINQGIDSIRQYLMRIYQDAKQLLPLTDAQLLQPSSLTLLDQMATQAQYAYTGQANPSTGTAQGGALWIYANLQRLAAFDVMPYTASTP